MEKAGGGVDKLSVYLSLVASSNFLFYIKTALALYLLGLLTSVQLFMHRQKDALFHFKTMMMMMMMMVVVVMMISDKVSLWLLLLNGWLLIYVM